MRPSSVASRGSEGKTSTEHPTRPPPRTTVHYRVPCVLYKPTQRSCIALATNTTRNQQALKKISAFPL